MTPPSLPGDRALLRREILRLAWPVVLQSLSRMTMFLVDTFMIGRVGAEAMAAMGVVGPISHGMTTILGALGVGATATVARAWGAGDRPRQEREAATALTVALGAGAVLSAAGMGLLPAMAGLFPVPGTPEVTVMARGYLFYEGAALFFFSLDLAAAGILRAAGNTRMPMAAALAGNVVNIFLNWVLIFGRLGAPRMGVAGAGLATAVSMALQAALVAGFLATRRAPVRLGVKSFRAVTRDSLRRFARVTIPAAIEPLVLQSGMLVYNKAITLLGVIPMAAHRAAVTIEALTYMPGFGFAVAGSALVGQFLGAGRPDRAEAAVHECARMATYLMSAVGISFLLFSAPLVGVFVPTSGEAAALAALCLAVSAFEQPFLALAMTLGGALRGAGDTRSPVLVAVIGVWLVRIPLAWVLAFPAGLGLYGIWLTMIADWLARTAVFAVIHRRGGWKRIDL